jgi:CubicO group peptidase (beta-lactamase class C family)
LAGIANEPRAAAIELVKRAMSLPIKDNQLDYNNINYALLGLVIEAVSGREYEDLCRDSVLRPLDVRTARLVPAWRSLGAFGGWSVSAVDYARFGNVLAPGSTRLGPKSHAFNRRAGEAFYGLGIWVRPTARGRNMWHHGNFRAPAGAAGPHQFSAFFARWDNGVSVVVTYDRDAGSPARQDLDRRLREVVYRYWK